MPGGYGVSASAAHHVALALYMRADPNGVVGQFAIPVLARDTRCGERTVRAAIKVLNRLCIFRSTRAGRRRPASHRMNLGGLDWPTVRARCGAASNAPLPFPSPADTPLHAHARLP